MPTQTDTEPTEPTATEPSFAPETRPTEPAIRQPDEGEAPEGEDGDTTLLFGVVVAVVAMFAAGAFLIFWKRKK
jgi:LPXTG-motif cell wall-anchored protein